MAGDQDRYRIGADRLSDRARGVRPPHRPCHVLIAPRLPPRDGTEYAPYASLKGGASGEIEGVIEHHRLPAEVSIEVSNQFSTSPPPR